MSITIQNNQFNELEILMPHGRIPKELLKEIWALINNDGDLELAQKLSLAAIEYSLCQTTNYENDREVMRELRHYIDKFDHNLDSYSAECEDQKINRQYDKIAKLYWGEHRTQSEISKIIGVTQQEISKRLRNIREKYPELYIKFNK